jgi:hypothetical protein
MAESCGCGGPVAGKKIDPEKLSIAGIKTEGDRAIPAAPYITGSIQSGSGDVPVVSTKLSMRDRIGAVKVRLGIGRMNYPVEPGLYAVGTPDEKSPVLVSSNYKLTFDALRKELTGMNAWILILDTKGVNVWCAAGKGTFGTRELVTRIIATELAKTVDHHTVIVPQLGAPGISAHLVSRHSGFHVVYGPVYARDIPAYLDAGMKKTEQMSLVTFTLRERLAVVPMEIVPVMKYLPIFFIAGVAAAFAEASEFNTQSLIEGAFLAGSLIVGTLVVPAFLPLFHPFRPFSVKGFFAGALYTAVAAYVMSIDPARAVSWGLIAASVSGYLAMLFTGATTFTSESGVRKELRFAFPILVVSLVAGIVLRVALIARTYFTA